MRSDSLNMLTSGMTKVRAALGLVVPPEAVPGETALVTKVRPLFAAALTAADNAVAIANNATSRLAPIVADPQYSPEGRKQRAAEVNAAISAELNAELATMRSAADAVNATLKPVLSPARPSSISEVEIDRAERHVLLELGQVHRGDEVAATLVRMAGDAIAEDDAAMQWVTTRDRRFVRALFSSRGADDHLALYDARVAQLLGDLAVTNGGDDAAARAISNALGAPYSLTSLVALVEHYVRLVQADVPAFVAQLTPSGQR